MKIVDRSEWEVTHYEYVKEYNAWGVTYSTSADFDYCRINGCFESCRECDYRAENGKCTCPPQFISTAAVRAVIEKKSLLKKHEILISNEELAILEMD